MAGATMCDGVSPASWTMYSPRSVSTGSMPRRASAAFRWISSDAILLLLTIVRAPRRSAIRAMSSYAVFCLKKKRDAADGNAGGQRRGPFAAELEEPQRDAIHQRQVDPVRLNDGV